MLLVDICEYQSRTRVLPETDTRITKTPGIRSQGEEESRSSPEMIASVVCEHDREMRVLILFQRQQPALVKEKFHTECVISC